MRFFSAVLCLILSLSSLLYGWEADLKQKIAKADPPLWAKEQIQEDLASFIKTGVTSDMLDGTMELNKGQERGLLFVRFKIVKGELIVAENISEGDKGRLTAVTSALKDLLKVTPLPDLDFIVTLHDALDREDLPSPVLVFAKHKNSKKVVLIPDFEALSDKQTVLSEVRQAEEKYPWSQKISAAVWRGSTTGGIYNRDNFLFFPRSQAVRLSLKFPSLVNAKFTQLTQHSDSKKKIKKRFEEYFGNLYSISEHMRYKYQLLIDGNSCAYSGAYWRFFSNCTVFKQDSPNIQWYYKVLKPNIHYVPLRADLSDLIDKIKWAKKHDEEMRMISVQSQLFAQNNLTRADILYYLYLVLTEYAKLQS